MKIAARTARDQARLRHARALEDLRDRLLARLTPRDATRSEADAEAVLAGLGQVMRPGPTVALRPEVTDAVIEALRGPFRLRVTYGSADATPRVIEPRLPAVAGGDDGKGHSGKRGEADYDRTLDPRGHDHRSMMVSLVLRSAKCSSRRRLRAIKTTRS